MPCVTCAPHAELLSATALLPTRPAVGAAVVWGTTAATTASSMARGTHPRGPRAQTTMRPARRPTSSRPTLTTLFASAWPTLVGWSASSSLPPRPPRPPPPSQPRQRRPRSKRYLRARPRDICRSPAPMRASHRTDSCSKWSGRVTSLRERLSVLSLTASPPTSSLVGSSAILPPSASTPPSGRTASTTLGWSFAPRVALSNGATPLRA